MKRRESTTSAPRFSNSNEPRNNILSRQMHSQQHVKHPGYSTVCYTTRETDILQREQLLLFICFVHTWKKNMFLSLFYLVTCYSCFCTEKWKRNRENIKNKKIIKKSKNLSPLKSDGFGSFCIISQHSLMWIKYCDAIFGENFTTMKKCLDLCLL